LKSPPGKIAPKFVAQQSGEAMAVIHFDLIELANSNADNIITGKMEYMTRTPVGGAGGTI